MLDGPPMAACFLIARKDQTAQEPAVNQIRSRDAETIAETDRQILWTLGRGGCGRRERKPSLVLQSSGLTRPRRRRSQGRREWQPGWSIAVTSQLSQLPRLRVLTMCLWTLDWMSSRRTSICSAVSARLAPWKWDIHGTARQCPSTAHIPNHRWLTVLCRSAHEDANEPTGVRVSEGQME